MNKRLEDLRVELLRLALDGRKAGEVMFDAADIVADAAAFEGYISSRRAPDEIRVNVEVPPWDAESGEAEIKRLSIELILAGDSVRSLW